MRFMDSVAIWATEARLWFTAIPTKMSKQFSGAHLLFPEDWEPVLYRFFSSLHESANFPVVYFSPWLASVL